MEMSAHATAATAVVETVAVVVIERSPATRPNSAEALIEARMHDQKNAAHRAAFFVARSAPARGGRPVRSAMAVCVATQLSQSLSDTDT
jgi:hypothetical protein